MVKRLSARLTIHERDDAPNLAARQEEAIVRELAARLESEIDSYLRGEDPAGPDEPEEPPPPSLLDAFGIPVTVPIHATARRVLWACMECEQTFAAESSYDENEDQRRAALAWNEHWRQREGACNNGWRRRSYFEGASAPSGHSVSKVVINGKEIELEDHIGRTVEDVTRELNAKAGSNSFRVCEETGSIVFQAPPRHNAEIHITTPGSHTGD